MNQYYHTKCLSRQALIFILITTFLLLSSCRFVPSNSSFSDTGFYYDTVITITLYDCSSQEQAQSILDDCMNLAGHYEQLLSPSIEGSDIWNINHSNGDPVIVAQDTTTLILRALDYAQMSNGVVDPTIGTLSQLWNFGSNNQKIVPEDFQIQDALSHVDYHSLQVKGNEIILSDPQAQLELGFIAKGFIADKLKELLISEGITSAIINLGGNVVTVGSKSDGSPFRIGIQDPFSQTGASSVQVDSSDSSVVSSGNYERFFEQDGKRYHHILSTENGYPADTGLAQITIMSDESTNCDALSTLCFLLGYEKSALLLEDHPNVKAIFITEDGEILYINF